MFLLEPFFRKIVRRGTLAAYEADGTRHDYGAPDPAFPDVTIRFTDPRAPGFIFRRPMLGAGETYMDGRVIVDGDDIRGFLELMTANTQWEEDDGALSDRGGLATLMRGLARRAHRRNALARSKRNVAHHYDLSDRLYALFLDVDRQYSCAYFDDPAVPLERAQLDKKAHIAAKLALRPGQRVLDIGCGWGGLALYLHRLAGVDVTGITLSEEQLAVARRRAEQAGVAEHVRFELIDYRHVQGRFDRIVSVGMFEHVGTPHYETFFAHCRELLANDGVMLLHTIGRMGAPGFTDAWTEKYIFPGGYSPALSEIVAASEKTRLIAADVETLRLHYAITLDHWYDRVVANRAQIEALYDARFFRMWTFYLAGAASAFRHRDHCNFQIQYIRDRHALPITRGYMADDEARLRAAEAPPVEIADVA